jgi:hypothetical protein
MSWSSRSSSPEPEPEPEPLKGAGGVVVAMVTIGPGVVVGVGGVTVIIEEIKINVDKESLSQTPLRQHCVRIILTTFYHMHR